MGILSTSEFAATLLAVGFLGVLFVGWVLRFVFQITLGVGLIRGTRRSSLSSEDQSGGEVLCPCIFEGRCSAFQLTLRCTVVSVAFFFLAQVSCTLWSISLLVACPNCTVALFFNYSHVFCMCVGYVMMFTTDFERLRLTFSGSVMELPQWAPNVLYAVALLIVALVIGLNAFRLIDSRVSAVCSFLLIAVYFVCVCALTRAFFKKTMAISSNADDHNDSLKKTAVRMTLVVTLSVLSSTVTMLLWVALFLFCPNCLFWRLLGNILISLDNSFSGFCLMCTFAPAVDHYMCAFGRLHNCLLAHVLEAGSGTQKKATPPKSSKSKSKSVQSI